MSFQVSKGTHMHAGSEDLDHVGIKILASKAIINLVNQSLYNTIVTTPTNQVWGMN